MPWAGSFTEDIGCLESEFWDSLKGISSRLGVSPQQLVRHIELESLPGGLASAIRVFVLEYFRGSKLPHVWVH